MEKRDLINHLNDSTAATKYLLETMGKYIETDNLSILPEEKKKIQLIRVEHFIREVLVDNLSN